MFWKKREKNHGKKTCKHRKAWYILGTAYDSIWLDGPDNTGPHTPCLRIWTLSRKAHTELICSRLLIELKAEH